MRCDPLPVTPAGYVSYPAVVLQVPLDGFAQTRLKRFVRLPVELALDLAGVNRIARVVSGAIFHEGDQLAVRHDRVMRTQLIEDRADALHDFNIPPLAPPADIVGCARPPFGKHHANGFTVIFYVEPVTDVQPVAINRQWLSTAGVQDHQRDQFFGKLVRTIVIGTIRGQRGQSVGVMVSPYQVIGSRLRGRVGAIRRIRRGFAKGGIAGVQRSVYFVGRDVKKAELDTLGIRQLSPVGAGLFEQSKRSIDIGTHKIVRTMYGTIQVTLCGKMNDCARAVSFEQFAHQRAIADVSLNEPVAGLRRNSFQVSGIAGVGEFVEVDERLALLAHPSQNEVGADESRASGDQDGFVYAGHERLIVLARKKGGNTPPAPLLVDDHFTSANGLSRGYSFRVEERGDTALLSMPPSRCTADSRQ